VLDKLFGSKLRVKALGWLMTHSDEEYFVRQLTKILDEDSANLGRELAKLAQMGILVSHQEGKQVYYQANEKCPVFEELKGLVIKTAGVADVARSALSSLGDKIRVAFIYGSFAGGAESRASDVDIMVIGDVSFKEVVSALSAAQETLARDVNPTVYPPDELRAKIGEGHHFLNSIFEEKKIFLIGDEDELARMAGKRLAQKTRHKPKRNR